MPGGPGGDGGLSDPDQPDLDGLDGQRGGDQLPDGAVHGGGLHGFAQVGTSATPSFNNTGLTASTTYLYRVRATDAAGNLSGYSNTATVSTPAATDTPAPTVPGGLGATAASATQMNLTWTASTDNVAVTNYLIERCTGAGCTNFAQVGTRRRPASATPD